MQGLLKLHDAAASAQYAGQTVDWNAVRRSVLRTKPPYEGSLENMISFVASRAGGVDGNFLHFMNAFFGLFVSSGKKVGVPSGLYRVLADFPHHYLAIAVWEAAYACPAEKVSQGGICEWVTISDVVSLAKAAASSEPEAKYDGFDGKFVLDSSERILAQARVRLTAAGISATPLENRVLLSVLAKLDIRMASFLLKKQEGAKQSFENPGGPLMQFKADLLQAFPKADTSVFDDLWRDRLGPKKPMTTAVAQEESTKIKLTTVGADGSLQSGQAKMRRQGFDVGFAVTKNKADPSEGMHRIIDITDTDLGLESLDKPVTRHRVELGAFLADGWKLADEKARKEILEKWGLSRVFRTDFGEQVRRRAEVLTALANLASLQKCSAENFLDIHLKPTKKVVVKREASAGQILLLPETLDIRVELPDGPKFAKLGATVTGFNAEGLIEVSLEPPPKGRFYLGPAVALDKMGPLWFVRTTADRAEANLEWGAFEVQSLSGVDFIEGASGTKPAVVVTNRLKSKKGLETAERGVADRLVRIPVLMNPKKLKAGEELLAFRPTAPKRDKEMAAITYASLAKRVSK